MIKIKQEKKDEWGLKKTNRREQGGTNEKSSGGKSQKEMKI